MYFCHYGIIIVSLKQVYVTFIQYFAAIKRPGFCPSPWKGFNGICDRRGSSCSIDSDCSVQTQKCCFNGCQMDCIDPDKPKPPRPKPGPVGECPKPWKDKKFCDMMGDRCRDESECYGNHRCCFNGCEKDCIKPGIRHNKNQ